MLITDEKMFEKKKEVVGGGETTTLAFARW